LAWVLWGIAGLSALLIIFLFSKVKLAIGIMKASSDFTRDVKQVLIMPLMMFMMISGFMVFWIIVSLYIYSSGDIVQGQGAFSLFRSDNKIRNFLY
jgi:hypothetical protein